MFLVSRVMRSHIGLIALVACLALACDLSTVTALIPGAGKSIPSSCPPPPAVQATAPGFPLKVTMAENTQGESKNPVNPTTTFQPTSTFHAVVHVDNAPAATTFGAAWFALDTGGISPCNTPIDASTLESSGTRNLDFILTPTGTWPAGTFRVQIVVNGQVAAVQEFNVK